MKVLIKEKISAHKSKTPEGYLICCDAILARTGKQEYYASEIWENVTEDKKVEVDRRPEEVFAPETIASFENKPLTIDHPDESVTPENYRDYAVGFVRDVKKSTVDGQDVLVGNIIVTDAVAIQEIEDGIRTDLSCGYDCDIDQVENPEQRNIRGNHVALCEQGRAGIAHIVDSLPEEIKTIKYKNYTINKLDDDKFEFAGPDGKKKFDSEEDVKEYIDDIIEKAENRLRDAKIKAKIIVKDSNDKTIPNLLKMLRK